MGKERRRRKKDFCIHDGTYNTAQKRMINFSMDAKRKVSSVRDWNAATRYNNKHSCCLRVTIPSGDECALREEESEMLVEEKRITISVTFFVL